MANKNLIIGAGFSGALSRVQGANACGYQAQFFRAFAGYPFAHLWAAALKKLFSIPNGCIRDNFYFYKIKFPWKARKISFIAWQLFFVSL